MMTKTKIGLDSALKIDKMSTAIIIAYYSNQKLLTNDFLRLLNGIKYKYKIIIAYNGTILNLDELDPAIECLKYGEKGYDLNCYMKGLDYVLCNENSIESVIFINNSIKVLDVLKFEMLLEEIKHKLEEYDFVGLIKNYEIKPHYQSFLFALSLNLKEDIISKLKKKLQVNPLLNRSEVIQIFEIETICLLNKYKLNHTYLFKPKGLIKTLGYINYILKLGFIDNLVPLKSLNADLINPSIFMKKELSLRYGFKKIKTTTTLNKILKI